MPKEKKVVVGLELKDREFLNGLKEIDQSVKKVGQNVGKLVTSMGGDFSTLSKAVKSNATAIGVGNKSLTDLKDILKEIRGHLADLKSVLGTTNTTLSALAATAGRTETGIKRVNENVVKQRGAFDLLQKSLAETITDTNRLEKENEELAQSFDEVATHASRGARGGLAEASDAYDEFSRTFNKSFSGLKAGKSMVGNMLDTFNPGRIAEAAGWNLSYGIVNAPGRAFRAISSGVKQAVDDTAGLEGELFDLEAYLGGVGGKDLIEFGRQLGATGSEENMKTAGLTALQNKILQVGQSSTFTAREIAAATSAAAKAGVNIFEIAGETGTALDAISLLSQNTGESLENSAEQVSKLQALFESNIGQSQKAFGQAIDAGKQYQIIVDGLATADQASASSAAQLTEALFNVGGSAANLNIPFFETISLVSQMVPAFESAASAGTSLKYVFSGISGGRSVKAKGAMKQFGLMDQYGQSVFFGKNEKTGQTEFRGIEFMTKKLREVFGDKSGMAVDVRNRIITDIFGQDALKAVSRMVSMTDEQAEEMYKMAADMTSNAAAGIQSAKSVADIKNEGLEYDIEFFKGTMDSLQKTLTMPLMKPMSNFVQTFSGLGNVAFAIITGAKDAQQQIEDTKKNLIDTSLLPGAGALFAAAQKYAVVLRDVLQIITKEGYSISSISQALATLFGGSANQLNERSAYFKTLLTNLYNGVAKFIESLPSLLDKFGQFAGSAFETLTTAFSWLVDNWDSVILGLKIFIGYMVVDQVAGFANNILDLAGAFGKLFFKASEAGGAISGIASMAAGRTEIGQLLGTLTGFGSGGGVGAAAAGATGTAAAASSLPLLTKLMTMWTGFTAAIGSASTAIFSLNGLLSAGSAALGFLMTPLGIALAAVLAFYSAWQNNTAGMADFLTEKFGGMWEFLTRSFNEIGAAILPIWDWICGTIMQVGQSTFMDGIANMFKSLATIIEGNLMVVVGIVKVVFGLIQGVLTGNWDLFKKGGMDFVYGLGSILQGAVGLIISSLQTLANSAIDLLNSLFRFIGVGEIDNIKFTKDVNKNVDKFLKLGGAQSGKNFADGLSEGMDNGKQKVAKSAYDLIKKSGLDVVDETQDAHSRSEETFQDGINFGDGLAQGISSQQGVVHAAASNLASAALSAVDDKFEQAYRSGAQFPFARLSDTYQSIYGAQATASNNAITSQVLNNADVVRSIVAGTYVTPTTTNLGRDMNFGPQAAGYVYNANATQQGVSAYRTTDFTQKQLLEILGYSQYFRDKYGQTASPEDVVNSREMMLRYSNFDDRLNVIMGNISGYGEDYSQSNDFQNAVGYVRDSRLYGKGTIEQINERRYTSVYGRKTSEFQPLTESIIKTFGGQKGEGVNINPYFWADQLKYQKSTIGYDKKAQKQLTEIAEATQGSDYSLKFYAKEGSLFDGEFFYTKPGEKPQSASTADPYGISSVLEGKTTTKQLFGGAINSIAEFAGKYDKQLGLTLTSLTDFNKTTKSFAEFGPSAAAALQNIASSNRADDIINASTTNYKNGMPTEHLDQLTGLPKPKPSTRSYGWDPYNFSEWINRGLEGQTNSPYNQGYIETSYTTRKLTPEEMKQNIKPLDFVPVTQIPQMSSFFMDGIIPEQYDGPSGMVSPDIAAYKQLYGEKGIEYQGLTKFFEKNPTLLDQYSQVGNRAATFLSLKQGKLNAEDYKTFQDLLALDIKDKDNYLAATKNLSKEQNKVWSDPTLNQEQKNTKIAKLQSDFTYNNMASAGSFRDVLGVKVGGLADYDTAVSEGKISEQAKPYTDTAFQRVREAYANALDPKNQSEAFKKLSPEEQDRIKKAALELPLQTQAYYNSAIADGVITDTERKLLEQYSGDDAALVAKLIADATLPTQDQINAAYAPYVHGTATVTAASNITGVAAPAWLSGLANIVTATAILHGQEYANGFVQGFATDAEGNKISLASVTVQDALNADPNAIFSNGVIAGESLPLGVWQGIANGSETLEYKVEKYFGPMINGKPNLIKTVYTAIKRGSPSGLYRDEVGKSIIDGVAVGILENAFSVENALKKVLGIGSTLIEAGQSAGPSGMGGVGSQGAEAAGSVQTTVSPYFAMGVNAANEFVKGFVNKEDPVNSFAMRIHGNIQKTFNPEGTDTHIVNTFLKAIEFGKKIAHQMIDLGFAYVVDGEAENSWTFASVVGNALAITTGDEAGKWTPQAKGLGSSMAQGIADGVTSSQGLIAAAVIAALDEAIRSGKVHINAKSPSKVFADKVGNPITAGIAMGITDSSYLLDGAMGGLMDGATRAYRPDISPVALAGQRQAEINANTTNNFNLGVHTSQNPQVVERSFAVMQSFKG